MRTPSDRASAILGGWAFRRSDLGTVSGQMAVANGCWWITVKENDASDVHRCRRRPTSILATWSSWCAPPAAIIRQPSCLPRGAHPVVRRPDIIWPSIGVDPSPMAAPVVWAIDQQAAHAHLAHFTERYFFAGASRERTQSLFSCNKE